MTPLVTLMQIHCLVAPNHESQANFLQPWMTEICRLGLQNKVQTLENNLENSS